LQVTTQEPVAASQAEPGLHWPSAVQDGSGLHDDRAVSQVKPVPQSVSVLQNPASVQVPSAQKHPAAHWTSVVQANPGGTGAPPGFGGCGFEFEPESLWSPKYSWQPESRDAAATAIARPAEESSF
jgi:hypothetical protein